MAPGSAGWKIGTGLTGPVIPVSRIEEKS